ncbi:type II CRISPR RNA-guided endonuclease Cas9 [Thalassospira xiamenensis]|uniref:CRISPR subtype II/NMENI RNA-guided endonuclease Cas9/Csn1 n=1 Tax=Thalassospira xiamenensis TaxID=220697 RepID=A0A285TX88_9PROT|nr:type II CRISPR RNA-guided endonuclease Cas9 [Thalassospira xiamenensis]SOC30331.1 CRISPR subtype II/NMENI RNA-guided endonuclease Cas9/Csn1 [Thalassospira xiamenensis]SOC30981.1 CRISPR subtype II/NMENI RNA-guided endonuclease Cas9/Csn1 [Thalassospira xiamenensis]
MSAKKSTNVALGVDVGVASLALCVVELDAKKNPIGILDGVSFVYPAADSAAERRQHRSARNGYQHKSSRLKEIRNLLISKFGLMPDFDGKSSGISDCTPTDLALEDEGPLDKNGKRLVSPNSRSRLRSAGLTQKLTQADLARAIMHIAKNRGMRLTRVLGTSDEDQKARKEASVMALQARETSRLMQSENAETPGQLLWKRELAATASHLRLPLRRRVGTSLRLQFVRGQLEHELSALLAAQKSWHTELTTDFCAQLTELVFFENPAPPPEIGRCTYNPETEARIPVSSDIFQQKRIYEEVNNLRIEDKDGGRTKLTLEQRDIIAGRLMMGDDLSASQIRNLLEITSKNRKVSIEGRKVNTPSKKLMGHAIMSALVAADERYEYESGNHGRLCELYMSLEDYQREDFEKALREEKDRQTLVTILCSGYGVEYVEAENAADTIALPRGYASTGITATIELLENLKKQVVDNTTAADYARLVPVVGRNLTFDRLPYYGIIFPHLVRGRMSPEDRGYPAATNEQRYGRIPNSVVHNSLNAIRKVVNAFLKKAKRNGWVVSSVRVELARELKKSQEQRDKDALRMHREQVQNAAYDAALVKLGVTASRKNRRKLRLWEAQERVCPYTGVAIAEKDLFNGKFDLDHILPRAKTLDDGLGNLLLVHEAANKVKGDKTPFEAFHAGLRIDGLPARTYGEILNAIEKTKGLASKKWRFLPDAMDKFDDENDFQQRYKSDTSYIAKTALHYILTVFPDLRGTSGGQAVNGQITSELRNRWGLGDLVQEVAHHQDPLLMEAPPTREERELAKKKAKNRDDHRHHLLDAAIAACAPRNVVQQLQSIAARPWSKHQIGVAMPWPEFRNDLYDMIWNCQTTHQPNRSLNKQLHQATGLGVVARLDDWQFVVRTRKRLDIQDFGTSDKLFKDLRVDAKLIRSLVKGIEAGTVEVLGRATDLIGELTRHGEDLENLALEFRSLLDEQPSRQEYEYVDKKTGETMTGSRQIPADVRLGLAFSAYRQRCLDSGIQPRRTVSLYCVKTAIVVATNEKDHPARVYRPGSNAWLDVYRNMEGELDFEIVRTIDAMRPGWKPQWQSCSENSRVLRLFNGDTVRLQGKDGKRRLCTLLTTSTGGGTSTRGDFAFQPINLSSHIGKHPARNTFRFSFKSLMEAQPELVVRDCWGRVTYESGRLN